MGCHQDRSDQLRLTESFPWVPVSPPEATTENMRLNSQELHGNSTSLLETFGFPVFQIQGVRPFSGEVLGMSRSSGNALSPKLQLHCGRTHVPVPVSRMLRWWGRQRRFTVGGGTGGGGGGGQAMLPWLVPLPATERLICSHFGSNVPATGRLLVFCPPVTAGCGH